MVAEGIGGQASGAVARRRRATLLVQYIPKDTKWTGLMSSLPPSSQLHIRILFDDKLKRNLTTELKEGDLPEQLTKDLVTNGLVNEVGGA